MTDTRTILHNTSRWRFEPNGVLRQSDWTPFTHLPQEPEIRRWFGYYRSGIRRAARTLTQKRTIVFVVPQAFSRYSVEPSAAFELFSGMLVACEKLKINCSIIPSQTMTRLAMDYDRVFPNPVGVVFFFDHQTYRF
jgi:hypothetical protein